jgi:hypothetical protein
MSNFTRLSDGIIVNLGAIGTSVAATLPAGGRTRQSSERRDIGLVQNRPPECRHCRTIGFI